MFVCWPVSTLLYYGLSLSANKIHMTNDVYLSFILVCLIEIPAYTLIPFVIDILGRKPILFVTLFIPGNVWHENDKSSMFLFQAFAAL